MPKEIEETKLEGMKINGIQMEYEAEPYTILMYAVMVAGLAARVTNEQGAPPEIGEHINAAINHLTLAGGGAEPMATMMRELATKSGQGELVDKGAPRIIVAGC